MPENLLVFMIVLIAVVLVGRRLFKAFSDRNSENGCESVCGCSHCPSPGPGGEKKGGICHDAKPGQVD